MPRAPILILAASQLLTACLGSGIAGPRINPLPPAALQPCAAPADLLGARDWEILAGRLGDALIDCEARRALAAQGYEGVRAAVGR